MSATVQNGTAAVIGTDFNGGPGFQNAFGFLNTGGVLVINGGLANGETTLNLQQKFSSPNNITATNSAIANSVASTSGTTLDPTVQNLNQLSVVGAQQMDFQSEGGVPSVTHLFGFQPGGALPAPRTPAKPSPKHYLA